MEQEYSQEAARPREKELRDAIETIPGMAWTCLPDGSHTYRNGRWAEYSGLSVEDATPFGGPSPVHPEDLAKYTERWRASLETGDLFENEARYHRAADGQYRWFLSRAVPYRDDQGNIVK